MGCIIVCFFVLLFTPFSLHYVFAFDTILIVLGLKHSTHFFNDFRVIIEYLVFKRGPCGSLFLFGLASMVCAWYLSSSSLVVVNLCSITKKFGVPLQILTLSALFKEFSAIHKYFQYSVVSVVNLGAVLLGSIQKKITMKVSGVIISYCFIFNYCFKMCTIIISTSLTIYKASTGFLICFPMPPYLYCLYN